MFSLVLKLIQLKKYVQGQERYSRKYVSGQARSKDDHQLSKKRKGVWHTINMDVLNNEQLLEKQGYKGVPQPWTYMKAKRYSLAYLQTSTNDYK
jgi:hypothetical protein